MSHGAVVPVANISSRNFPMVVLPCDLLYNSAYGTLKPSSGGFSMETGTVFLTALCCGAFFLALQCWLMYKDTARRQAHLSGDIEVMRKWLTRTDLSVKQCNEENAEGRAKMIRRLEELNNRLQESIMRKL
jgi:hypothetical protein